MNWLSTMGDIPEGRETKCECCKRKVVLFSGKRCALCNIAMKAGQAAKGRR